MMISKTFSKRLALPLTQVTLVKWMSQNRRDERMPPPPKEETKEEKAAKYSDWKKDPNYIREEESRKVISDIENKVKDRQGIRKHFIIFA